MREPPRISETAIRAAVLSHYAVYITTLTFLPIGNDSMSFVYEAVATNGTRYFLKLRTHPGFRRQSLLVPRYLHEQGVPHIVAPLLTTSQQLWVRLQDFVLMLYPFLDACTAVAAGLADRQWHALGAALRQIHTSQLPPELQSLLQRETWVPWRRQVLDQLAPFLAGSELADPLQRELLQFWQTHQATIGQLISRSDELAAQLRQAALPLVLCHADLHTWNVLLATCSQLWIVDWDEVMLAPKERDLMFVIGGIGRDLVTGQETTSFLKGYANAAINRWALIYYRYAWAVQEMGAYAEQLFFTPDASPQAREDALLSFFSLFEPGNIVEIACAEHSGTL